MTDVISNQVDDSPVFLSILLPAYNYVGGILRILNVIKDTQFCNIEIIIGDNSSDSFLWEAIEPILRASPFKFYYQWNNPTKSPIENWNWLINSSNGEYLMMIHHDEFPADSNTLLELINTLSNDSKIDALLLNCHLVYKNKGLVIKHFNSRLRDYLIRINPNYLYRRNLIGPTAILVARKKYYPLFDTNLMWLVDVDMYARLFRRGIQWVSCAGVIYSEQERVDSLTSGLGSSISALMATELEYLRKREEKKDLWLGPYPAEPMIDKCGRSAEWFFWNSYRCITKVWRRLYFWLRKSVVSL